MPYIPSVLHSFSGKASRFLNRTPNQKAYRYPPDKPEQYRVAECLSELHAQIKCKHQAEDATNMVTQWEVHAGSVATNKSQHMGPAYSIKSRLCYAVTLRLRAKPKPARPRAIRVRVVGSGTTGDAPTRPSINKSLVTP